MFIDIMLINFFTLEQFAFLTTTNDTKYPMLTIIN